MARQCIGERPMTRQEKWVRWKTLNPERHIENVKRNHARRKLKRQAERKDFNPNSVSIHAAGFKESPYQIRTPIELCTSCAQKYLVPLGCLWCNKHNARRNC